MSERNPISILDRIAKTTTVAGLHMLKEEFSEYGFASVNTTTKFDKAYRNRLLELTKEGK